MRSRRRTAIQWFWIIAGTGVTLPAICLAMAISLCSLLGLSTQNICIGLWEWVFPFVPSPLEPGWSWVWSLDWYEKEGPMAAIFYLFHAFPFLVYAVIAWAALRQLDSTQVRFWGVRGGWIGMLAAYIAGLPLISAVLNYLHRDLQFLVFYLLPILLALVLAVGGTIGCLSGRTMGRNRASASEV